MRSQRSNLVRTGRWQQYEMLVIGVASGSFCIYGVVLLSFFYSTVLAISLEYASKIKINLVVDVLESTYLRVEIKPEYLLDVVQQQCCR